MSFCNGSSSSGSIDSPKKTRKKTRRGTQNRVGVDQKSSILKPFHGGERGVAERLAALKTLISAKGEIRAEHLFVETANYIVLMETRVAILQRLIEFYGK